MAEAYDESVTRAQRLISACYGSILTSLFVTPLDVIKVRLQAQIPYDISNYNTNKISKRRVFASVNRVTPATVPKCTHYQFCNGLMEHMCPKETCVYFYRHNPQYFTGTIDAAYKIVRYEGVRTLYNGLPPTLVMAIPATMLYFNAYDELKAYLLPSLGLTSTSLIAGGLARLLAATVVSPLELLRTQLQYAKRDDGGRVFGSLVKHATGKGGYKSLWCGLTPTLLRDVPFSMLYWAGVEYTKQVLYRRNPNIHEMSVSFLSGLISGTFAAAVTTPFDVIKTRVQVDIYSSSSSSSTAVRSTRMNNTSQIILNILSNEGIAGLTAGMIPRVVRIAPSCAIMITSYEVGKRYFSRERPQ